MLSWSGLGICAQEEHRFALPKPMPIMALSSSMDEVQEQLK